MKNLLVILLTLTCTFAFGQKIKSEKISYPFLSIGKTPIKANFKTYSVKVISHEYPLEMYGWTKSELVDQYFGLEKYTYVEEKGDLEMIVSLGSRAIVDNKVKKNKSGAYEGTISYGLPLYLAFKDGKRQMISEQIVNKGTDIKFAKLRTYGKVYNKAKLSWQKEQVKYISEFLAKQYAFEFKKLKLSLASIDNRMDTEKRPLYYIKDGEKHGMSFSKDDAKAFKEEYKDLSKNMSGEEAKVKAEELLAVMQPYLSSKVSQVSFVANYNSALANLILDNYQSAKDHLIACQKFDHESKAVKKLIEEVDDRMERINASSFEQDEFVATYDDSGVEEGEVENMVTGEKIELRDYVVDKNGNKIHGILHVKGLLGGVVNRVDIDTRKEDQERMTRIEDENIREIGFDGKVYVTRKFKDPGNLNSKTYCLLKVHENKDVLLLLKTTKDLNSRNINHTPYYVSEGDDIHVLKSFNMLNFNKGVRKKLSHCSLVVDNAKSKVYDRKNPETLIQLVDDLASCR